MADKLAEEHQHDDVTKVRAMVEKDNQRWTSLIAR